MALRCHAVVRVVPVQRSRALLGSVASAHWLDGERSVSRRHRYGVRIPPRPVPPSAQGHQARGCGREGKDPSKPPPAVPYRHQGRSDLASAASLCYRGRSAVDEWGCRPACDSAFTW